MRNFSLTFLALFVAMLAFVGPADPQLFVPPPAPTLSSGPACGGFTGHGDKNSHATAALWLGAWGSAQCGTKAVNVCLISTHASCVDINSLAANGKIDRATIISTFGSVAAAEVAIWYDQTGNGKNFLCASGSRPALVDNNANVAGTVLAAFTSGTICNNNTAPTEINYVVPYSTAFVVKNLTNTGNNEEFFKDVSPVMDPFFNSATNAELYCGDSIQNSTVVAAGIHSMQFVCNTGTNAKILALDNSTTLATAGTLTGNNNSIITWSVPNGTANFAGAEVYGNTALSSTDFANFESVDHTNWATP